MPFSPRVSVIIQGPLLSTGNSGDGTFVKDFDCVSNIRRMMDESRSLVDTFILSTWRESQLDIAVQGLEILELDDPGQRKTYFSKYPNNDLRQAYGCYEGIKFALSISQPDYVLKVRTDMYVDIPALVAHMRAVDSLTDSYQGAGQEGFLYFPNMISWSPYSVGDFYVGGHACDMLRFFDAQVQLSCHSLVYAYPWVHADLMLRHAYQNLRGKLGIPEAFFFPNITPSLRLDLYPPPWRFRYHPSVLHLWGEMLTKSISLFSRDINARMEWRGHTFRASSHSSGEFYEEWLEAQTDPVEWLVGRMPALYLPAAPLTHIQRFINFNLEKSVEMRSQQPALRRYMYGLARFVLSVFSGIFPRVEFPLMLWLKLMRWVKDYRRSIQ